MPRQERLPNQILGRGFKTRGEEFCGLPAYFIDKLIETGLYGITREQVVENFAREQIRQNLANFRELGLSIEEAHQLGYVPIKFKKEKSRKKK